MAPKKKEQPLLMAKMEIKIFFNRAREPLSVPCYPQPVQRNGKSSQKNDIWRKFSSLSFCASNAGLIKWFFLSNKTWLKSWGFFWTFHMVVCGELLSDVIFLDCGLLFQGIKRMEHLFLDILINFLFGVCNFEYLKAFSEPEPF